MKKIFGTTLALLVAGCGGSTLEVVNVSYTDSFSIWDSHLRSGKHQYSDDNKVVALIDIELSEETTYDEFPRISIIDLPIMPSDDGFDYYTFGNINLSMPMDKNWKIKKWDETNNPDSKTKYWWVATELILWDDFNGNEVYLHVTGYKSVKFKLKK